MSKDHQVVDGDCISSIAWRYGFFPDMLWNHPSNASLKELRGNPNVLAVGDVVHIPSLRDRIDRVDTGASHQFRIKSVPAKLRLEIVEDEEPMANQPFVLQLNNGKVLTGLTDGQGRLAVSIPPDALTGELKVGTDDDTVQYSLKLGQLHPVDLDAGLRSRLDNMAYPCSGDNLEEALRMFQKDNDLPETGIADDATRAKLVALHGS